MKKIILTAGSIVFVVLAFVGYSYFPKTVAPIVTQTAVSLDKDKNKFVEEIDSSMYYTSEDVGVKADPSFYATKKFLFKDGEFSYYIYPREREGLSPIVRESTTGKEFTGLRAGWSYEFSSDNHWMIFDDAYRVDGKEGLCAVRIAPPIARCIGLVSPNETFEWSEGDSGEPLINRKWLDENTLEVNVYKKPTQAQTVSGFYELTEVIRTQRINLK